MTRVEEDAVEDWRHHCKQCMPRELLGLTKQSTTRIWISRRGLDRDANDERLKQSLNLLLLTFLRRRSEAWETRDSTSKTRGWLSSQPLREPETGFLRSCCCKIWQQQDTERRETEETVERKEKKDDAGHPSSLVSSSVPVSESLLYSDLRSVFSSKSRWKRENKKWKGQEKDLREDKSRNASETKQPVNQSRFMSSSKIFYWFRCFIIFTLFISFLEKLFFFFPYSALHAVSLTVSGRLKEKCFGQVFSPTFLLVKNKPTSSVKSSPVPSPILSFHSNWRQLLFTSWEIQHFPCLWSWLQSIN